MDNLIHCVIPARKGSKRLKGKNTRLFLDKPLISWTIEEAMKSKNIGSITVSTDDEAVMEIANNYGISILQRPQELAADDSTTSDVVLHFISGMMERGDAVSHIMLLQPTSPLRTAKHIEEAIDYYFFNIDKIDSLISVSRSEHPPWWNKKIGENGLLTDAFPYDRSKFNKSQDFPRTYIVNGAIYIAKVDELIIHKGFETGRILPYIMERQCSIDIDNEFDLLLAEFIAKA
ncbi:MAG TPA: acylneuraminate cytidylyltransferase family protein [Pseudobacteroides sp.]|uniref:acylneuraminate cytidylyltransferase family protein n=1 Tax=Pseudobacteroides sp. TaxID=1968840 RepID=UPI002F93E6EA